MCRSLLAGDAERPPADLALNRLQAGSCNRKQRAGLTRVKLPGLLASLWREA